MRRQKLSNKQKSANGVILYEGPSIFDGSPIVQIATGLRKPTLNRKVRNAIQVWTIPSTEHPLDAIRRDSAYAVCRDCAISDLCYVNRATLGVIYGAYQRGAYPKVPVHRIPELLPPFMVWRLGAYGNPSAVPYPKVMGKLAKLGVQWLSYEHAWSHVTQSHRAVSMASCETLDQAIGAASRGWRSYTVVPLGETKKAIKVLKRAGVKAIACPYDASNPATITCDVCRLCDGKHGPDDKRPSIVAEVHESPSVIGSRNKALAILQ